jgi:acetyl esterase/lipase
VQTFEKDVLRDEGDAYARKLNSAGVAVTAVSYNGMIHDFGLLGASHCYRIFGKLLTNGLAPLA